MSDVEFKEEAVLSFVFDNKKFESGVQESLGTIDKLKKSLNFDQSVKNIEQLEKATNSIDLSGIEKSLKALEDRFSVLGVAGMEAVRKVTDSVMHMGANLAKDLVSPITKAFSQIKTGGMSRALKIDDARFKIRGLLEMTMNDTDKISKKINKLMASDGPILSAVKGTAYGLDAAAGAASQLLSSGVKIKDLEGPLTAISGAAAMTGRSYEDIGNIFATVAGQGKLMTMQLRQFEAANVNAAKVVALYMHKTEAEVREMVTQGKVDFQTFSNAMEQAFADAAKKANDTIDGARSNVNAALSRIGATVASELNEQLRLTYVDLIPIIDGIKTVITPALESINKIIDKIGIKVREVMASKDFLRSLSGVLGAINIAFTTANKLVEPFFNILSGIYNIFKAMGSVLKPIAQAFLDIFPLPTLNAIKEGTKSFKEMTENLKISARTSEILRGIFRGIFMVFKAGIGIIKSVWKGIQAIVKWLSPLAEGFLNLAEGVATALGSLAYYANVVAVVIQYTLAYFGGIGNIVQNVIGVIAIGIAAVGSLITSIFAPIGGFLSEVLVKLGLATEQVGAFGSVFEFLGNIISGVISFIMSLMTDFKGTLTKVWDNVITWLQTAFGGALSWFADILQGIGTFIYNTFRTFIDAFKNTGKIIDGIKAVFSGFVDMLKDAGRAIADFAKPIYTSVVEALGKAFTFLADGFKKFSEVLTPGRIAAIAFLAILVLMSLAIRSFIKTLTSMVSTVGKTIEAFSALPKALTGVIGNVSKTVQIFNDRLMGKGQGIPKFINILKEMSKMLLIVFGALYMLSTLPQEDLKNAAITMGAVAAGLLVMAGALTFLGKRMAKEKYASSYGFRQLALGMIALASAIGVLSISLKILDGMSGNNMVAKALVLSILVTVLGRTARKMSEDTPHFMKGAIGILFFALGVGRVVKAMADLIKLPIDKVLGALPVLAAVIAGLGILARSVGNVKLPGTVSLLVLVFALKTILKETQNLGTLIGDVDPLAILAAMGGVIAAIVVVAKIMNKGMSFVVSELKDFGVAMVLMSGAIYALTLVIRLFDGIKMSTVGKGLIVIAACMGLFIGIEALAEKTFKSKPIQFAASLSLMAIAIGMLGGLTVLFGFISLSTIVRGMTIIAGFTALFGAIEYLAQYTKDAKPLQMGGMFMLMAGAIAMLAGVIVVLGLIKLEEVIAGGAVVGAIVALMALLVKVSESTKNANPKEIGTMFLKMAAAIGIMAACVIALGMMKLNQVIQGGVVIGAFMVAMAILEHGMRDTKLSGLKQAKKTLIAFLGIIGIMLTVVLAMKMLEGIDMGTLIGSAAGLSATVLAMAAAMAVLSKIKMPDVKAMGQFAVACFGLVGIAAALYILQDIDWKSMLTGAVGIAAVLISYGAMFKLMNEVTLPENFGASFLEASLATVVIAGALLLVAGQPWDSLLAGAVGIAAVLIAYGQVFAMMSTCPKPDEGVLESFLGGSLALLPIAAALTLVATQNWASVLASGGAIAAVLAIYGQVFSVISTCPKPNEGVLTNFLLGTLALIPIAGAIIGVAALINDPQSMLSAAVALGSVLMAYGAVFTIIGAVGAEKFASVQMVAAIAAFAAGLDAIIAIVGILTTLIGWLDELFDIGAAINRAIPIVKDIGEAIGGFIGEIVGSFVESVIDHLADTLPHLGKCLSEFGINLMPFFDAMGSISSSTIDNIGALAGAILALTAAEFLDGISKLFSFGTSSFETLGLQLMVFGNAMLGFDRIAGRISDPERFQKIAVATAYLAEAVGNLPTTGGAKGLLFGNTDWEGFNTGVKGLISSMVMASDMAESINKNNLEKVAACGEAFGKMSDSMPRDNGLLQIFTGSIDWVKFKNGIISLTSGMVQVCTMQGIESIDQTKVENIAAMGKMMAEMADTIPNTGGFVSWIVGNNDLDDFGKQIAKFGNGIAKFVDKTKGISKEQVDNAVEVSDTFIKFCANALKVSQVSDFTDIFDAFNEVVDTRFPEYGRVLTEFSNALQPADPDNFVKGQTATNILTQIFSEMNGASIVNFKNFSESIKSFGIALRSLNTDLVQLDDTQIDLYVEKISYLAKAFNESIKDTDFSNVSGFAKSLEEINNVSKNIEDSKTDNVDKFTNKLIWLGDSYKNFSNKVKNIKPKTIQTTVDQIKMLIKTFKKNSGAENMDFGNFEKLAKNMKYVVDLSKIANKADGEGNLNDLIKSLNDLGENAKIMLQSFDDIREDQITGFGEKIRLIQEEFKTLNKNKINKGSNLGAALSDIGTNALDAINKALDDIKKKLSEFKDAGVDAIKKFNNGLTDESQLSRLDSLVGGDSGSWVSRIKSAIKLSVFQTLGAQITNGVAAGITQQDAMNNVSRAAAEVGEKAYKALKKEMKIKSPSKVTEEIGKFTVMGFTKGLEENDKSVYDAGIKMGESAEDGVKDSLGIHSPATAMIQAAYNAAKGFIKGCADKAKDLFSSGFSFGGSFFDGLKEAIGGINKGDFSGDKMLDKIKDSLGLNKLGDALKEATDTSKFAKNIGKGLKAGTAPGTESDKDSKGAGANTANSVKEGFTEQMKLNTILMAAAIKGSDISNIYGKELRQISEQMKFSVDQYASSIGSFRRMLKGFSKDSINFVKSTPEAIAKYIKSYNNVSKTSKNIVNQINKNFKNLGNMIDATTKKEIVAMEKRINQLEKQRKKLNKILENKDSKSKEKKAAKESIKSIDKEIESYKKQIELKNNVGAVALNTFAESLYKKSDSYKKTKKNIEKYTKEYNKLNKEAQKQLNIIDNPKASNERKKKAYEELESIYGKVKDTRKKLSKEWKKIGEGPANELKKWRKATKEAIASYLEFTSYDYSYKLLSGLEKMEKASRIIDETAQSFDFVSKFDEDAESATETIGMFTKEASNGFDMFSVSLEKTADAADDANSGISQTINLLERFTKTGTVAKEALFENADSQLEAYEEFLNGLAEMKVKGFDAALIKEMASQGPQALNYIRGYLTMTAEEVSQYNQRYTKKLEHEGKQIIDSVEKTATKSGETAKRSYLEALTEESESNEAFEKDLKELANRGLNQNVIDKFREMGREQGKQYVDSLLSETSEGINKINDIYKQMNSKSMMDSIQSQIDLNDKFSTTIQSLQKLVSSSGLNQNIVDEISSMSKEEAIEYGTSILENLDKIPTLNEYYTKLSAQAGIDVNGVKKTASTLWSAFESYMEEESSKKNMLSTFLSRNDLNANVKEYVEGLELDKAVEFINKFNSDIEAATKDGSLDAYITKLNETFSKFNKTGVQTINDNLDSQIDAVNEYNSNMAILEDRFAGENKDLYLDYLRDMGTEGAKYVKALAEASQEDLMAFQKKIDAQNEANNKARLDKMMADQQKKLKTLQQYGKNMTALAMAGADQNFLQSIIDMGPEQGAQIAEMYAELLSTDPEQFKSIYKQVYLDATDVANKTVDNIETAMAIALQKKESGYGSLQVVDGTYWYSITGLKQAQEYLNNGELPAEYKEVPKKMVSSVADNIVSYATSTEAIDSAKAAGAEITKPVAEGVKEGTNGIGQTIVTELSSVFSGEEFTASIQAAGKIFANSILKVFTNHSEEISNAGKTFGKVMYRGVKTYITEEKGDTLATKFVKAIRSVFNTDYKNGTTAAKARQLANSIKENVAGVLTYAAGEEIARNFVYGLANGLADKQINAEIARQAKQMADTVVKEMQKAADEHSPSKRTEEIGRYLGAGLVIGMRNSIDSVRTEAEILAEATVDSIKSTMDVVESIMDGQGIFSPTIKPRLDLSQVISQARDINGGLDASIRARFNANSSDANQNESSGGGTTFIQNNYSPKALSRQEIYRQTRNQFAMARRAVNSNDQVNYSY